MSKKKKSKKLEDVEYEPQVQLTDDEQEALLRAKELLTSLLQVKLHVIVTDLYDNDNLTDHQRIVLMQKALSTTEEVVEYKPFYDKFGIQSTTPRKIFLPESVPQVDKFKENSPTDAGQLYRRLKDIEKSGQENSSEFRDATKAADNIGVGIAEREQKERLLKKNREVLRKLIRKLQVYKKVQFLKAIRLPPISIVKINLKTCTFKNIADGEQSKTQQKVNKVKFEKVRAAAIELGIHNFDEDDMRALARKEKTKADYEKQEQKIKGRNKKLSSLVLLTKREQTAFSDLKSKLDSNPHFKELFKRYKKASVYRQEYQKLLSEIPPDALGTTPPPSKSRHERFNRYEREIDVTDEAIAEAIFKYENPGAELDQRKIKNLAKNLSDIINGQRRPTKKGEIQLVGKDGNYSDWGGLRTKLTKYIDMDRELIFIRNCLMILNSDDPDLELAEMLNINWYQAFCFFRDLEDEIEEFHKSLINPAK